MCKYNPNCRVIKHEKLELIEQCKRIGMSIKKTKSTEKPKIKMPKSSARKTKTPLEEVEEKIKKIEGSLEYFMEHKKNPSFWEEIEANNYFEAIKKLNRCQSLKNSLVREEKINSLDYNPLMPIAPRRKQQNILPNLLENQKKVIKNDNEIGPAEEPYIMYKNVESDIDVVLDRYFNGERTQKDSHEDMLLRELSPFDNEKDNPFFVFGNGSQLTLTFPEEFLVKELEKLNIKNIKIDSFNNGREAGLTYTVASPNGDLRTFSVYEHRNRGTIIINGKTNAEEGELPYAKDDKNAFFAESDFSDNGKAKAARDLAFFLKEAQKGELDDDDSLVRKCEKIDVDAELAKRNPAFREWLKEQE